MFNIVIFSIGYECWLVMDLSQEMESILIDKHDCCVKWCGISGKMRTQICTSFRNFGRVEICWFWQRVICMGIYMLDIWIISDNMG